MDWTRTEPEGPANLDLTDEEKAGLNENFKKWCWLEESISNRVRSWGALVLVAPELQYCNFLFWSLILFLLYRCWASAEDGRRFSSPHGPQHGDRSDTCTGKPGSRDVETHTHTWHHSLFPTNKDNTGQKKKGGKKRWMRDRQLGRINRKRKKHQTAFENSGEDDEAVRCTADMTHSHSVDSIQIK